MIKNKKFKWALIIAFLLIEAILFVLVQTTNGKANDVSMMLVVILNALYFITCFTKTKEYIFTALALLFTITADFFLVALNPANELLGVIFFSFVQIFYFLRLYFNNSSKKRKRIHLILQISISVLSQVVVLCILGENADALSLISLFYFSNFVLNVVFAFIQRKKSLIFAIGLLLFLCCDILVGLNGIFSMYFKSEITAKIYDFVFGTVNMPWIFYVPSQVLLALSLTSFKDKTKA